MSLRLLSPDPEKRRGEVLLLGYAPLWIAAVALVALRQSFTTWGDAEHLLFGVGLAAPLFLLPFLPRLGHSTHPLADRYLTKAVVFITLLSFLQNYFGTDLFFTVLGMRYHFHTRLLLDGSPLFLYFMTVAYFSTYFVLMQLALRAFGSAQQSAAPSMGSALPAARILRVLFIALLSYTVAFCETLFMANQRLHEVFSYADKGHALFVGSLCYGTIFFVTLPLFYRIDEPINARPVAHPTPLSRVIWEVLGANLLILCCYEVYKVLLGTPYRLP